MNPNRVDFAVDLAYGLSIFIAIGLILVVGTSVGIAFGLGVLVSYVIHIGWKMARFDPEWMTREVAERVEDTVSKEVDDVAEKVEKTVSEEVTEEVEKTVSEQVEKTVGDEVDEVIEKIEEINEPGGRESRTDDRRAETAESSDGESAEKDPSRDGT